MMGPCAKAVVTCTLVAANGRRYWGDNGCNNAQPVCPRDPGERYEKCKTICRQPAHAELRALAYAGAAAVGAHAYIDGISYACRQCQEALFGAGVVALTIGPPPPTVAAPDAPPPARAGYRCTRCGVSEGFARERGCSQGPCPMEPVA